MTDFEYISVDIEADGQIPAFSSMLSIGAARYESDTGQLVDIFSVNLLQRPDAQPDEYTMAFWGRNPKAWKATRAGAIEPLIAMERFRDWIAETKRKSLFVGYPVTYDFMWVYDYFIRYLGWCPFGFSGVDIKTAASLVLKTPFHRTTKRNMPREWFTGSKHSHIAVEDAVEQGELWLNILRDAHV